ncbi:MAG: HU family DNA-binding protein [Chlorobi bacterium]|nr:HU family DNA-binding protein [Chlorobiota bacterium]
MNKTQLIEAMAADAGITKAQAKKALDSFMKNVTETLKKGGKVTLIGFGTFSTVTRKAREGRNPATGEKITIPAKTVVKFKPGSNLEKAV